MSQSLEPRGVAPTRILACERNGTLHKGRINIKHNRSDYTDKWRIYIERNGEAHIPRSAFFLYLGDRRGNSLLYAELPPCALETVVEHFKQFLLYKFARNALDGMPVEGV